MVFLQWCGVLGFASSYAMWYCAASCGSREAQTCVAKTVLCSIVPAAFSIVYWMIRVQGTVELYNQFSLKINWPVCLKLQEHTCFQDAFMGFLETLYTDLLQTYEKTKLCKALAWIKLAYAKCEAWNKVKVSLSFVGLWSTESGLVEKECSSFYNWFVL